MRATNFLTWSDRVLHDRDGSPVRVAFQSRTGQVYVLSDDLFRQITATPDLIEESVVRDLQDARVLVAADNDEFTEVANENIQALKGMSNRTFVLMPSSYCNMGCGYCGQRHFKSAQSPEHRQAVIDRLTTAARLPATTALHVNWFGAEPMMGYAQIKDISAAVIAVCDEVGIGYSASMVTNGSLLTLEKTRILHQDCRVTSFEVTLDGSAATHDVQRRLKGGGRSFDRITSMIASAVRDDTMPDLHFSIRTNVSRANCDDHSTFAATVAEKGLAHPRITFYATLVREWGNDVSEFALSRDRVIEVDLAWQRAYRTHGLTAGLIPTNRNTAVCVAVTPSAEVIDPLGNVHSCTEQPLVPGREDTTLGTVTDLPDPSRRPEGAYDSWNENLRDGITRAHCTSCSIFPICGGQCPLSWLQGKPPCPSIKFTMPARLTEYGLTLGLLPSSD